MTRTDFAAILPLIITAYAGVVLTVVVAFWRSHLAAFSLTLITLAASFGTLFIVRHFIPQNITPLIRIDQFSLYFCGLVIAGAFLVTLFCREYFMVHEKRSDAFYLLLILAVLGMEIIVCSMHFVSFFLGLEILSVSLYGLIGYTRGYKPSLEGAIKYLVLAAASSSFLLFGIALIYADTGVMNFQQLAPLFYTGNMSVMSYFGMALVLVAFGFKLAVVPFHMWSPDVYQGAPAPVTALIATGSKGAVFALLLRLAIIWGLASHPTIFLAVEILAIATMFTGNLLALLQNNVKRLLAYSSIAHIGYLLIPLLAGGTRGPSSIAFYLASYFATTIAAFGVISVLSSSRAMGDVEELDDYRGLAYRHPILAAVFGLALLSLTGIPLTSGFIAKFYIFTAAAYSGLWALLIIGIINSGISAFYYLRVLLAMYTKAEVEQEPLPSAGATGTIALFAAVSVILVLGVYPTPLIHLAEWAVKVASG